MTVSLPHEATAYVKTKIGNFVPRLGIVLGSGLSHIADEIQNAIVLPYAEIPYFPQPQIAGHPGKLVIGELNQLPVACLSGRIHYYERRTSTNTRTLIRTLKLLGCDTVLLTNAAGSLRPDVGPGHLVLINDHINLTFENSLAGPNDEEFGPRFVDMKAAYDPTLNQILLDAAAELKIVLPQGVYLGVLGPSFETPAEIRAFSTLGADLVGMSTIPEVLVARHCGLKVAAISVVSNLAAGMSHEILTHAHTLQQTGMAVRNLSRLISTFAGKIKK